MQAFDTFRIGNDPELRYTPGNNATAVINLSLACNYGRKDEATGKRPTQWVDATLWGKQAEALAPYLVKGGEVTVTLDDLHMEEFQRGNNGGTGYKLAGRISNLKLVGSAPQQQAANPQSARQPAPRQQGNQQQQRPAQNQQQQGGDDFYDDQIPF
ncbi:Single-stranded DNA-binding protein [compost metagenome]